MQLTVAIIGAPHGLKGEVRLDVRTDSPARRLAVRAQLETDPADFGPLTITRTREYRGVTYALFAESTTRDTAEALRGVRLIVETDEDEPEEDAYYAHELRGLEVLDPEGYELGIITGLENGPAQDVLVVREPDGRIARVPFVREIVTAVDLDDHCVVVDAPAGLFSDDDMIVVEGDDLAGALSAAGESGLGKSGEGESGAEQSTSEANTTEEGGAEEAE
ncbi:ribosome maturation factor RimM [Actinotignum sp. GS-2025b]|uniref:ribosome maturation factor RimM n=1 Tax=Actinotignum sp. GS-2025b TaxID=3427275 RepID=UPI003F47D419